MATEAILFFGLVFLILLVVAWRTGVFRRGIDTPLDSSGSYPQI